MGMIGNFVSVDEDMLTQVIRGKEDIYPGREDMDVDKAWHAIHYLLCGDPWEEGEPPMSYVVPMLEGQRLEDSDIEACYLTPEQTAQASAYLQTLSDQMLKEMYDFQSMVEDEVYPVFADDDPDELYEYIYDNLMVLKDFYEQAAKKSNAVIFYVS